MIGIDTNVLVRYLVQDDPEQSAQQGKVLAYKFQGKRFDCGSVSGFVSATNYFSNKVYGL